MLVLVSSVRRLILHIFRKRTAGRKSREVRSTFLPSSQTLKNLNQKTKQLASLTWHKVQPVLERLWSQILVLGRKPITKRVLTFARTYSGQLGFTALVIVFLMITVGEGQAYDVSGTMKLASSLQGQNQNNGFFGKPQLFSDQTVSTGEVQQQAAIVYQVATGDSIVSIADRYSLSPGTILDANHISAINANKITPGQQLLIPAVDTNTSQDWLAAINAEKQRQIQLAEQQRAEQQKKLAQSNRNTSSSSNTSVQVSANVTYVGTQWGSYNGGYPGQCTWYVNSVRKFPGPMGNGGQYLTSARSYGMATGSVARVGATIVTSESWAGHVAQVIGVGDGTVTIKEMNYLGPGKIDVRTISASSGFIKGYVY